MANKVYIDVVVDDKGTTQRVALSAKTLGKALDKAAVSAETSDKMLKGAGGQSSNTTKNFSKMAQGITGGLVPAYAILAAQIFAVSAAFNFLKSSGTLVTLQQGQIAYAAATGTALRTLAKDIIAATDAQITFQDASQAAAIGIASGISPDQLTKLGTAARDASFILGRDVTDSFNRLVRGVTKAEPELLDELGIILRLETATTQYANAINKNVRDLTAFERSQAVANDVLTQAEQKYSGIMRVLDPQVNQFAQLSIAFDTILNKVKVLAVTILGPLAKAFTEVPALAIAFLGVFAKGIITAMIPGMEEFGETAKRSGEKWADSSAKAKEQLKALQTQAVLTNRALKAQAAERIASQMGGMTFREGGGFAELQAGRGAELNSRQLAGMKTALTRQAGMFAAMDKQVRAGWVDAINSMIKANKDLEASSGVTTQRIGTFWQITTAKMRGAWASTMTFMASAAVGAANVINKAFYWLAIISTVATVGKLAWDKIFPKAPLTEAEKAIEALQGRIVSLTEEYVNFNQVQNILNEGVDRSSDFLAAFGARINSLSLTEARMALESLTAVVDGYTEALARAARPDMRNLVRTKVGIHGNKGPLKLPTFEESVMSSGTETQKSSLAYFKSEVEAFRKSTTQRAKASIAFEGYISKVEEYLKTGKAELIPQILGEKTAVQEVTMQYASLQRQQEENIRVTQELFNKYVPETEFDRAARALKTESTALQAITVDLGGLNDAEQKRLQTITRQIKLLEELASAEHKLKVIKEANTAADTRARIGATSGQIALLDQQSKARDLEIEKQEILRKQAEIRRGVLETGAAANAAQQRELELNEARLDVLRAQSHELHRQMDLNAQLVDSANQGLENSLRTNIAAVIKGEEASIKTAMLNIARGMITSVADTLANQITNLIMGTSPLQIAAAQGKIIATSFLAAGSQVAAQLHAAMFGKQAPFSTSVSAPTGVLGTGAGAQGVGGVFNFIRGLVPFASGGVVNKPTPALIGEGKYNEAVVPLPNGKAIPVQMNGAGQNNNVTVNVAIDGNGNASTNMQQDSQQAGNLGALIARAVQQELQNQKRSGGILNPYGVA